MSAALFMAISLAQFDSVLTPGLAPHEVLTYLDRAFTRYTQATHQNYALCYVEHDGLTLHAVNAGGIPPFIRRADGRVEWLKAGGLPLGIELAAELSYQAVCTTLAPRDMVILISDGVVEAVDATGRMFGFAQLEQAITAGPTSDPKAMLDHLSVAVRTFVGGAQPRDDITTVVFQPNT